MYLGIDIGSTGSKAILMDADENIIGRGITHSGSNLQESLERVTNDVIDNARIVMFSKHLDNVSREEIESQFRYYQFCQKLEVLKSRCIESSEKEGLSDIAAKIFQEVEKNFSKKYDESVSKSDLIFFGDFARSLFLFYLEQETQNLEESAGPLRSDFNTVLDNEIEKTPWKTNFSDAMISVCQKLDISSSNKPGLDNLLKEIEDYSFDILHQIITGYGSYELPFKEEQKISEISCHALGAHYLFPKTRTILDIGGQDMKAISIDEKANVLNRELNDKCAAGTGRFLQEIAGVLGYKVGDIGKLSLESKQYLNISDVCTVLATVDAFNYLRSGYKIPDILNAYNLSIAKKANKYLQKVGLKNEITFTGGVSRNEGVVKSLKDVVGKGYKINISPDSQYNGAIGAALFAKRISRGELEW